MMIQFGEYIPGVYIRYGMQDDFHTMFVSATEYREMETIRDIDDGIIDFLGRPLVERIVILDEIAPKEHFELFYGQTRLTEISGLGKIDTQYLSSLKDMFNGCRSLTDINGAENWDISNVTNMSSMFHSCKSLVDISAMANWNVSKVATMRMMFYECESLKDISSLRAWNTAALEDPTSLLHCCYSITDISPLADWNMSSVETMDSMFRKTSITDVCALSKWDVSSVRDMTAIFSKCFYLGGLAGIGEWNTKNLENISGMVSFCENISLDAIAGWDVSNVKDYWMAFRRVRDASGVDCWKIDRDTQVFGATKELDNFEWNVEIDVAAVEKYYEIDKLLGHPIETFGDLRIGTAICEYYYEDDERQEALAALREGILLEDILA